MRSDIVPGAVFPDYELSDHRGKRRKLSELQQQDPMIVVLSRGAYCPKDRRQHGSLRVPRSPRRVDAQESKAESLVQMDGSFRR